VGRSCKQLSRHLQRAWLLPPPGLERQEGREFDRPWCVMSALAGFHFLVPVNHVLWVKCVPTHCRKLMSTFCMKHQTGWTTDCFLGLWEEQPMPETLLRLGHPDHSETWAVPLCGSGWGMAALPMVGAPVNRVSLLWPL
jgi:hypothetical protein